MQGYSHNIFFYFKPLLLNYTKTKHSLPVQLLLIGEAWKRKVKIRFWTNLLIKQVSQAWWFSNVHNFTVTSKTH